MLRYLIEVVQYPGLEALKCTETYAWDLKHASMVTGAQTIPNFLIISTEQ